jgi:tight adherence protein B
MGLAILLIAIFLFTTALLVGIFYLLIAAPASDRAFRSRLKAIQTSAYEDYDSEQDILRHEILSRWAGLNHLLAQFRGLVKLQLLLQQAGLAMNVARLLVIVLGAFCAALLLGLLLGWPLAGLLILACLAGAVPFIIVAVKRQKRFSKFDEQFPDAIDLLGRAVRAGHAFTTGLELIATEMPEPVATEFRRTYEQQNVGLSLREALNTLLSRVPTPDVHVFVTALIIQREAGGNLAEVLDNLSRIIRERFKLSRQVKVFTAQGRMSLYVLTALTPVVGFCLYLLNPQYILRLFTDPLGKKMLIVAVCLELMGYFVINRITRPKY